MGLTRPRYSQIYDADYKNSVRLATTGDVGNLLAGGNLTDTIDGKTLVLNDRILVKDQTDAKQNGIYRVSVVGTGSNGTWVRAQDADGSDALKVTSGLTTISTEGTTNAGKSFRLITPDPITVGTTNLTFIDTAGTPTGSNTQVQFNDLNFMGASSKFTFEKTSGNVTITGNVIPGANITYDLGSPTARWRTGYFAANTINLGGSTIGVDGNGFSFVPAGSPAPIVISANGAMTSNTLTASTVTVVSSTPSTHSAQGALVVTGGLGVGGNINVGGDINVLGNISLNALTANTLNVAGGGLNSVDIGQTTPAKGDFTRLAATGIIYANSSTVSTSTSTGALVVTGGLGVSSNVYATTFRGNLGGGSVLSNIYITGSLIPTANVTYDLGTPTQKFRSAYFSGNTIYIGQESISVDGSGTWGFTSAGATVTLGASAVFNPPSANIANQLSVSGPIYANSSIASTSTSTGALVVTGGAGISGAVNIGGNLTVTGNLFINGNATTINSNNLTVNDSIIYLAEENPADTLDIGITAHVVNPSLNHVGFVRDATDGVWKLFSNVSTQPSNTVDFTNAIYSNLRIGNLIADNIGGTLTTASQPNITSLGNLTSLAASGSIATTGPMFANSGIASTSTTTGAFEVIGGVGITGNIFIGGGLGAGGSLGSSGQVLQSTGTGLQWATVSTSSIANGTSNVAVLSSGGNVVTTVGGTVIVNAGTAGITVTGNISLGNLVPSGGISAGGSLGSAGQVLQSTGSGLQWTAPTAGSQVSNGTSNVAVLSSGGNVVAAVGGSIIANIGSTGMTLIGGLRTTGNVTAAYVIGNGSQLTGLPAGYTNTDAANYLPTHTGNVGADSVNATNLYGTIRTATQTSITRVGTLTALAVTANSSTFTDTVSTSTANKVLRVVNNVQDLAFSANLSSGSYNNLVGVQDAGIIFSNGTQGQGNLTIGPWIAGSSGIRIVGNTGQVTIPGFLNINSNNNATAIVNGGTNGVGNIGASGAAFNTVFARATSAQYADLAEIYTSDQQYPGGTVVVFGGEQEVTQSHSPHDTRIAGVVSTNPAYLMNDTETGVPVALQGRVPCRVLGPVDRGDVLVSSHVPGVAQRLDPTKWAPGCVIGKALQAIDSADISIIEVVVGRF